MLKSFNNLHTLNKKIFLPGNEKQLKLLEEKVEIAGKNILIIGTGCEVIAVYLKNLSAFSVKIIVSDYESMLNSRILLPKDTEISTGMMDFKHTDFNNSSFDIVYAQASISTSRRNKIIKEIKRILQPGGYLCAGEVTCLKFPVPAFIQDLWDSGDILPLAFNELKSYYQERNFNIISEDDLSYTLMNYYSENKKMLKDKLPTLSDKEKSFYKIILNRLSHESNVYLKLGGKDFMGFTSIILRKEN